MNTTPKPDDWEYDTECPECGGTNLGAIENSDGTVEMVCGATPSPDPLTNIANGTGCGHTWEYTDE